jgi:hypothetical protein
MNTQHGNQFLINTAQTLCLRTDEVELPKDDRVSPQHQQNYEHEAQYQTGSNVKLTGPKEFL